MTEFINSRYIGTHATIEQLHTPALLIDIQKMNTNSALMEQRCRDQGIVLRPHAKSHRSVAIARRQIRDGAIGICTATLGEAEVMLAGGIHNTLITSPIVKQIDIERMMRLSDDAKQVILVVDSLENAQDLEKAFSKGGRTLDVLLDLDPGIHRTGILPGSKALEIAQYLVNSNQLSFRGVQMYAGNLMHIRSFEERKERSQAKLKELSDFCDLLAKHNIECEIRTGGGTGTFNIDPEVGILTDLQAGSYLFMDRQYCEIDGLPFEPSLFVASTVMSANTPGIATIDAGLKSFATDDDVPLLHSGLEIEAKFFFMGDEHGALRFDSQNGRIKVGTVVQLLTPHCDPTFNLYDCVHIMSNGILTDILPIDARGHSY